MTEVKTSLAAKLSVAFVAAAMIFTMFAPGAQAQTSEEMQQMINDLLAQVSELQAQLGQDGGATAGPAGVCPYTWTRNLGQGDRGEDVMRLQQLLNSDPDTRVAASGPGSAGMETEYYGALTAAAVSKMQTAYRSEVLTPLGLQNPTGYFGNSTRAKANELCAQAPAPAPTPDPDEDGAKDEDEDEDEDEDDTRAPLSGGEATLDRFNLRGGEFSVAREGQSDVPVAELEVEVADGDAAINRLDLALRAASGVTETRPWEVFRTFSVWVDGEKVAEVDADRRSDYSRNTPSGYDRLRMTGLDIVLREDQRQDIVIAVTPNSTVRGLANDVSAEWFVRVPDNGFRMRDSLGIDTFYNEDSNDIQEQSFDVEESGADDEVRVRESNNDPSAATIEVEDNRRSGFVDVFAFDLDTRDSINEIEITQMLMNMDIEGAVNDEATRVVDDARIVIDGQTYRNMNLEDDGELTFSFDDELFIGAGDRVNARLQVRFKQQDGNYANGTSLVTTVSASDIDAIGANEVSELNGSAESDTHTLVTEGVQAELVSSSESEQTPENDPNYGDYRMTVDVTAIGDDIVIPETAVRGTTTEVVGGNNYGIAFTIGGGAGTTTIERFEQVSGGSSVSGQDAYRISEGSTATFELVVRYEPASTGSYRLQMHQLGFGIGDTNFANDEVDYLQELRPADNFRSASLPVTGN